MDMFALNIEAQLNSSVIFDRTKPWPTFINNKERPSIFIDSPEFDRFRQVYFLHDKTAWQYVAFMRKWFGLDVRSFFKDIQEKEDVALGYYEGLGWDQDHRAKQRKDFFEYLLINSCILVFAILSYQNEWNTIGIISATKEKMTDQKSMECYHLDQQFTRYSLLNKRLMLTMDNQIPWFVVEYVYTRSELSNLVGTPIDKLAFSCFDDLYPRMHKTKMHGGTGTLPPGGFKHLLHIFHWTQTPEGKYLVDTKSLQPVKKMDSFYIPSATELRLSSNYFDLHTGGSMDVSYYERGLSGVMKLAPWLHFPYSIDICKDLLKFEQGYENCGFPVTAYVACMVCLLRREADVILLRETGIIPITSDEKDILLSVEELQLLLRHDARMSNDLTILLANVKAHHERSSSKFYGKFKNSPWISTSVIGGILLFVLTFIQTIYTAVSYYKQ